MLLLVDKPTWWTSHDVVKYVKVHGKYKKVWHAGTLDPLATWLLLLLTDEDTKQMASLVWHDKRYSATIDLSRTSDTRDSDYHAFCDPVVVENIPTLEQVQTTLQSLIPQAELLVPSFSAKKKDGRTMYKDARQWVVHDMRKVMDIYSIELLSYEYPFVEIRCHVGSGTFIRSIAYTLWELLKTWGIITVLRREAIGDYTITDPTCIKDLADMKQNK